MFRESCFVWCTACRNTTSWVTICSTWIFLCNTVGLPPSVRSGSTCWSVRQPHGHSLAAPLTSCTLPPSPLVHRPSRFLPPQLPAQDKLRAIHTTFRPQDALSLSLASRCRPLSPLGHQLPVQENCELIASHPAPLASCLVFVSSLFCPFSILLAATINTKYSHMAPVCPPKKFLSLPRDTLTDYLATLSVQTTTRTQIPQASTIFRNLSKSIYINDVLSQGR